MSEVKLILTATAIYALVGISLYLVAPHMPAIIDYLMSDLNGGTG